jgi:ADP-ribosylglycohydrolase
MVFTGLLNGTPYTQTGRIAFKDGSYANGGCMRIHPVGVAFRNATDDELYEAVRLAIISSHVHPCAIVRIFDTTALAISMLAHENDGFFPSSSSHLKDGAFIQAKAIATLLKTDAASLDIPSFLASMVSACRTDQLKTKLSAVVAKWDKIAVDDVEAELNFLRTISEPFQIEAVR